MLGQEMSFIKMDSMFNIFNLAFISWKSIPSLTNQESLKKLWLFDSHDLGTF